MGTMKVINKLDSYDGLDDTRKEILTVKRAWNWKDRFVVLQVGDEEITVNARELKEAVDNATTRL